MLFILFTTSNTRLPTIIVIGLGWEHWQYNMPIYKEDHHPCSKMYFILLISIRKHNSYARNTTNIMSSGRRVIIYAFWGVTGAVRIPHARKGGHTSLRSNALHTTIIAINLSILLIIEQYENKYYNQI